MVPVWLHDVVLAGAPRAMALITVARGDRPDPDEHLRLGLPCPFCHRSVLAVVQGDRGPLEVRQGLAAGRHCLHASLPA